MSSHASALGMVVVQTTSQCNLNCDYCYLSADSRSKPNIFDLDFVQPVFSKILNSPFVSKEKPITVLWHDGEPLLRPIEYYKQFIERVDQVIRQTEKELPSVSYELQTNGTLINEAWCNFFREKNINVGLSCDGPALIQDAHRKKWNGAKTSDEVERAFRLLNESKRPIQVLSTVTPTTLKHAEEFFWFLKGHNVQSLGLNFVKQGANHSENWLEQYLDDAYVFLKKLFALYLEDRMKNPGNHMVIREFEYAMNAILGNIEGSLYAMGEPFVSVSISSTGDYSTFAPALLFEKTQQYENGNFFLGNMVTDPVFDLSVLQTGKFQKIWQDIQYGVGLCQKECEYFELCGGQLPAHKYGEYQSFRVSESQYCKISVKMTAQVILETLNEQLNMEQQVAVISST